MTLSGLCWPPWPPLGCHVGSPLEVSADMLGDATSLRWSSFEVLLLVSDQHPWHSGHTTLAWPPPIGIPLPLPWAQTTWAPPPWPPTRLSLLWFPVSLITPGRLVTLQNVQGLHETNEVHHWDCQTRHQYQQLHWVPIYSHAQLIIYLQTLVLDLDSQKPRCLSGEEVTMSVTVFKDSVNLISIVIRYYFY